MFEKFKTFCKNKMVKFNEFIVNFGRENLVFAFLIGWICSILSPLGYLATSIFTLVFGILGFFMVKEDSLNNTFYTIKTYLASMCACIISIIFSVIF